MDHPKNQKCKRSLRSIFDFFKKYEPYHTSSQEFEKSLKSIIMIHRKTIMANKKYLDLLPELELSRITKQDRNIWFVNPTTSSMEP
ncbi:hypothetical protein AYI70_g4278 [Smittium culicis]|uniref:Uncharacterized protein n=1 Tax=Smittium culicis TaxID=133412 RepID=A0A1R1Y036_9FUNG|nr:hypothetical protein AYI70_g4278 [Smittium culicis]